VSDPRDVTTDPVDRRRVRGVGEADDAELLSESAAVAPSASPGGQATSAGGGYGSGSEAQSSGGSGSGEDDTSRPGEDSPTEWLRGAPGTADPR
jgi:hypothetical protein